MVQLVCRSKDMFPVTIIWLVINIIRFDNITSMVTIKFGLDYFVVNLAPPTLDHVLILNILNLLLNW